MDLVKNLILEIISFLENNLETIPEIELLKSIKNVSLRKDNFVSQMPNFPPKERALSDAISSIESSELLGIKESLERVIGDLRWNIDDGDFYEKDSEIGESYLLGNMNCELIGPTLGAFRSNGLRLGLFLLEENIFYKDHKHKAAELYLNLTNGTQWRFGDLIWENKQAGSIVFNKPYDIHAMKIGSKPFLSIWCWPTNSSEKCILVPQTDWGKIKE
tara:strand:+ start:94 stop:744 length:651 start_codon:yes stop_codon:yes gene_type:complete